MSTSRPSEGIFNSPNRPSPPVKSPSQPALTAENTGSIPRAQRTMDKVVFTNESLDEKAKTFHLVQKVKYKDELRFFKHNPPQDTNPENHYMSECEAGILELIKLFSDEDDLVPEKFNTHVNEHGTQIGISVKAVDGFVSLKKSPLSDTDLQKPSILTTLINVSLFRVLLGDDDITPFNLGKFGQEQDRVAGIDLDMGFYHILAYVKKTWLTLRPATRKRLTKTDIENFPDISRENAPFFWLTTQPYENSAANTMQKWFSENAFTIEENEQFKKTKNNPIVIYQKFKDLLRFLITSDHTIQNALEKHIRPELTFKDGNGVNRYILSTMMEGITSYKKYLFDTLVTMQSFQNFLTNDGGLAYSQIIARYIRRNNAFEASEIRKWDKHPERKADILVKGSIRLEEVSEAYSKIFEKAMEHAVNEQRKYTSFSQKPL